MFLFHLTCLHYHQQCEKNWNTSVYKNWKRSVYPWQVFGIINLEESLFISKANNGPFWSHSQVPWRLFLIVCFFWGGFIGCASILPCGPHFSYLQHPLSDVMGMDIVLHTCSRKHQCLSFVFPMVFSPLESVFLSIQYCSLHEDCSVWVMLSSEHLFFSYEK